MKMTELFTKTRKDISKEEESTNAKLLLKGGFINKEMAGVFSYLPLGLRVLKKIENIIREEMNSIGGQEVLMPTLTSIENYKTTGREKIDVLFKTKLYNDSEFILNQSHEEVVVPLAKNFINSYRDLPVYIYQIQNKFRNEARAKSGLLRAREFIMKDLYSFHSDEKDLDKYYELAKKTYFKLFRRMGIDTILTYASGGTFSKYSHEFQVICDSGEDEIYLCNKCNIAVNKEIINEQKKCPECSNSKLEKKKSIEVGNIFKLNTKFSNPFKLIYKDTKGQDKPVIMGCYGIGLGRAMGTIVEISHDEKGIIWPNTISPFKVHLIEIKSNAEKIYNEIKNAGIEVLYDNRDVSAGEKLTDSDLIGCPVRIILSERTEKEKSVEIKFRNKKESKLIKFDKIIQEIK